MNNKNRYMPIMLAVSIVVGIMIGTFISGTTIASVKKKLYLCSTYHSKPT